MFTLQCQWSVMTNWHNVSWEPEGHYCSSKMFRWEPEGRYCCIKSMAIAPFSFSTEHLWSAIAPFWFSTEHLWSEYSALLALSWRQYLFFARLIAYCQQYRDYDSFFSVAELGSNPWISDDTAVWEAASTMWVDIPSKTVIWSFVILYLDDII